MRAVLNYLLLFFTLSACAADPVPVERTNEWPVGAHWCPEERPAHVIVSDALEPDCAAAMSHAVVWWAAPERGVDYLTFAIVPDEDLTWSKPVPMFIQVTTDIPEKTGAAGDTRIARLTPTCLQAAEIRFDPYWCRSSSNTARHELGHALGLPDLYDPKDRNNLMYWIGTGSNEALTEAQLEQVR